MLHFIFPEGSPSNVADEMFADQVTALTTAGFSSSVCQDSLIGNRSLRGVPPGSVVVYRGWMVTVDEYVALVGAIEKSGATPLTSPTEYQAAHYLPNWYPLLVDLTPETRMYPPDADIEAELRALGWGAYFLKDYVKSLKTGRGSIVRDPAEGPAVIAEMAEYRGRIEGGICVRRFEEFVPGSERRYFVLGGVGYAASDGEPVPAVVRQCARRIASPFFSVDLAQRRDGVSRVVEVGDGQVSDLVGWSAARFAEVWSLAEAGSGFLGRIQVRD